MKKYAVGADIGGHHITTAVVNLENAEIVRESISRKDVNAQGSAESILSAWAGSINESIEAVGAENIQGIGIAMPGPFDYPNGISLINDPSQNKFLSLYQMNIREALADRTGIEARNIFFKNDAECFLLGEVFGGAGKGSKRAIGVTLGTGFGSAFEFEGVSQDGELWCAPYKEGIAEDFISTRWFVNRYKELTGKEIKGVRELAESYDQDPISRQLFKEFSETLVDFLAPLCVKHQADTLVLGGNIAQASDLYCDPLKAALPTTKVTRASLGEEAALIGGASLLTI